MKNSSKSAPKKSQTEGSNPTGFDLAKFLVEFKKQVTALREICPQVAALSAEERRYLSRPAKERWAFVEAAMSAGQSQENVLPRDVDVEQVKIYSENYHQLQGVYDELQDILRILSDQKISLGNQMLSLSNEIYEIAERKAKRKVPNAAIIVERLKKLKASGKKKKKEEGSGVILPDANLSTW